MKPIIFHIDVNSAYLSWTSLEKLKNGSDIDLRTIPAIIGGDEKSRHGIVLAKSIPAKKYGIQTAEPVASALRKCPGLVVEKPDHTMYRRYSRAMMELLSGYTPDLEQVSIDECYLDFTPIAHLYPSPEEAAARIRDHIFETFGFTVNVGISNVKVLAKMASDFEKPGKVHTLYPEEMEEKMWTLPVSDLFFVGRATTKKLLNLGIMTIGELAKTDPVWLKTVFKNQGEIVWNFANGIDFSPVVSVAPPNKGYGNSTTTPYDVVDEVTARKVLLALSETVGSRLRKDHVEIELVSVGIRYSDLSYVSHQKRLKTSTDLTMEIYNAACELFVALWNGYPIRHLGVHTGKVQDCDFSRQMVLFDDTDYEKLSKVDDTIDVIRKRFGNDAVKRAVFVNQPIDHMSGGISREKRSVDYSKIVVD